MTYRLAQDANGGPVLETARLRLRMPTLDDIQPSFRFWSSDRSRLMGGPWTLDKLAAETQGLLDQWQKHGFSLFTVTLRDSGPPIGGIGPFYPDTHPEPELGWSLWDAENEGKGLAHEAAAAARDWFFATSGFQTAISYTDRRNHRSHRLCERLGGRVDPATPGQEEGDVVYRYNVDGGRG
ncbi:MAG: GNAT family N-acetyltransferase [Tabrizicola sp.]|nr:GNAT family N-acetyltransferase [Tabrizicola sp.]